MKAIGDLLGIAFLVMLCASAYVCLQTIPGVFGSLASIILLVGGGALIAWYCREGD